MRTCIGCRRQAGPEALVRVIRRSDGTLEVGRALPGRGAWLCTGSPGCVDAAVRRQAFDRALRGRVAPEAVALLREEVQACARMRRCADGGDGGQRGDGGGGVADGIEDPGLRARP